MNRTIKKTLVTFFWLAIVGLLPAAYETSRGFGRDVQKVGGKIEESAEKATR